MEREIKYEVPEVSDFMDVAKWLCTSIETFGIILTLSDTWCCSLRR